MAAAVLPRTSKATADQVLNSFAQGQSLLCFFHIWQVRFVPSTEVRRVVRPGLHTSDALRGPLPLGLTHTILERHRYTAQLLDESD